MPHSLTLFFLVLIVPTVTAVLIHCFSVLNFDSKSEFAHVMSRVTLTLFLIGCIGCIVMYVAQTWDVLAIFGASTLLMFLAFARASLVMVVVGPRQADTENVNTYF